MAAVREEIEAVGVDRLVIDDLTMDDLERIAWSGSSAHLRNVATRLEAVARGEADYLAVRSPSGDPIAKGGITYDEPDAGEIMQVATDPDLQGLGIASRLISVAEERIRSRGLGWAVLGVEEGEERTAALYRRLGYEAYATEEDSWIAEDEDGCESVHHAIITMMRKKLT